MHQVIVDEDIKFMDYGDMKTVYFKVGPNGTKPEKRAGPLGDACYDIFSAEDVIIRPFSSALVKTDLHIKLPPYYHLLLRDKSGPSNLNCYMAGGVIDNGYRGEINVHLHYCPYSLLDFDFSTGIVRFDKDNWKPFEIKKGQKICQGFIIKLNDFQWEQTNVLDSTERGFGGYGSTGLFKQDSVETK